MKIRRSSYSPANATRWSKVYLIALNKIWEHSDGPVTNIRVTSPDIAAKAQATIIGQLSDGLLFLNNNFEITRKYALLSNVDITNGGKFTHEHYLNLRKAVTFDASGGSVIIKFKSAVRKIIVAEVSSVEDTVQGNWKSLLREWITREEIITDNDKTLVLENLKLSDEELENVKQMLDPAIFNFIVNNTKIVVIRRKTSQ